jgi:hypothetical protein
MLVFRRIRVTDVLSIVPDDTDLIWKGYQRWLGAVLRIDPEVCAINEVCVSFDDELITLSCSMSVILNSLETRLSNMPIPTLRTETV